MSLRAILWVAVSSQPQAVPEKESLPSQERDLRAICQREGWRVVDTLIVPGHSRRYIDIHRLAEDAAKEGIEAFNQLLAHFKARDFDVILVRDADRFARTQSLHAYIVESIIDCGAFIFSQSDGRVDASNFRMFIAMSGYKAAGSVDALVRGYQTAMSANARKGLMVGSRTLWSHRPVRDDRGRVTAVEVDESKRRVFDDLAALILEGVSWFEMEIELYRRFGHINEKTGKRFPHNFFYKRVHHPTWWGHAARRFRNEKAPNKQRSDLWVFDESEPLPEGVELYRDVYPAVWTGDLGERIKAELRRRRMAVKGSARSYHTRMFTGLLICGACGHNLKYAFDHRNWVALVCNSKYWSKELREPCLQKRSIHQDRVREHLDAILRIMIRDDNPDYFVADEMEKREQSARRVEQLRAEIDDLEQQARRLTRFIIKQDEGSDLRAISEEELVAIGDQLKILKGELETAKSSVLAFSGGQQRRLALDDIIEATPEVFWTWPEQKINQYFHALMGRRRLVLLDGKIEGTGEAVNRQRRQPT